MAEWNSAIFLCAQRNSQRRFGGWLNFDYHGHQMAGQTGCRLFLRERFRIETSREASRGGESGKTWILLGFRVVSLYSTAVSLQKRKAKKQTDSH